ncbi:MAG: DUF4271 domain-containing protein [Bacteroidetes bacterium]|nr:DUF4271 domain-containing protein [Bacteroidota bacterium]
MPVQVLSAIHDTLMHDSATVVRAVYEPLFSGNLLKPFHPSAVFRNGHDMIWPAILLFVVFSFIVFARVTEPKKLTKVFTAFYSLQASKQLQREDYKIGKRLSVILLIVFLVCLSFFLYSFNAYFGFILRDTPVWKQFLFFMGLVGASYLVKYMVSMVLGHVINMTDLIREYIFNVSVFSQVLGITLFPFVIALEFSGLRAEWFLYPGLVIFMAFYLFRFVRGFAISGMEQGIGFFYIFLYLCALEILPLLVLVKFILTHF